MDDGTRHGGSEGGDDDSGAVDDARPGRVEEPQEDARGERPSHAEGDSGEAGGDGPDGNALIEAALVSKIEEASPQDLFGVLLASQKSEWRGLLPPPGDYNRYDDETKRSMRAWNDAQIIDASRRSDRMAEAEIKQGAREQLLSFALNVLFIGTAFASFIITGDAASFGFLAVPGITIAVNLYRSRPDAPHDGKGED